MRFRRKMHTGVELLARVYKTIIVNYTVKPKRRCARSRRRNHALPSILTTVTM